MTVRKLTKKDFDKIIRSTRNGGTNASIAKSAGFSTETIRVIRSAGTWKRYNELKAERNAKRRVTGKRKTVNTKTADDKLQKQLEKVPDTPITPDYVRELLDGMQAQKLATENLIAATEKQTNAIKSLETRQINEFFRTTTFIKNIKRVWWSRR